MTLPASGLITMAQIQTEFGGSSPISLSEYYGSGGAPASGTISMDDFHGLSAGWTITEGASGSIYGYRTGAFGSISGITTYSGATIREISMQTTIVKGSPQYYFQVSMSGNRAQTFFTSIVIAGFGTLGTGGAGWSQSGGNTFWNWAANVSSIDGSGATSGTFV